MTRVRAVGLHLSTRSLDGGLTVGRYEAIYVEAADNANSETYPAELTAALGSGLSASNGFAGTRAATRAAGSGVGGEREKRLVAVAADRAGLGFDLNRGHVGVSAGYTRGELVLLPSDFEGVLILDLSTDSPGTNRVYFRERKP